MPCHENGLLDNLACRLRSEVDGLIALRRNNGKLGDDEPIEVLALDLLARHIIERNGVEIREQDRGIRGGMPVYRNDGKRISYSRSGNQRCNH